MFVEIDERGKTNYPQMKYRILGSASLINLTW